MNKNYFEIVSDRIKKLLPKGDFTAITNHSFEIKNKNHTYEISNDIEKKIIVLKEIQENSQSVIASWLFDEEKLSQKDINLIVSDFTDIIAKNPNSKSKPAKKKKSQDESNITGLYFANRMVNVFPEIKEDITREKENYSEFRSVTFSKNVILPKINTLLESNSNSEAIKKLAKLLSGLYQNATLDVRSIITMCILNNLTRPDNLVPLLSDELQKAYSCALKYKGKTVKPENPKRQSSWISKALSYQEKSK